MNWLWEALRHTLLMTWQTVWALVLGFAISAALQVFVSKERMAGLFGRASLRSIVLAMGFGAASSSCSYAAAAAGRSAFARGAALVPALAFMFASTNLVIELCAVLWLLLGWRFVLAESLGAFILIGLLWALAKLAFPRGLEDEARRVATKNGEAGARGCCHDGPEGDHDGTRATPWQRMADAFVMDWRMLWKEIAIGFLMAGLLSAAVPMTWWRTLFVADGPAWLVLIENALVAPLVAAGSFVCSVGNIPLAGVLWSGGVSFGGVIAFIYADLLIIPLVLVYRSSYGARAAAYITGVFYLSMAGAGLFVDVLFGLLGLKPDGTRPPEMMAHEHFSWNYTTWLDLVALVAGGVLLTVHLRKTPAAHTDSGHGHASLRHGANAG